MLAILLNSYVEKKWFWHVFVCLTVDNYSSIAESLWRLNLGSSHYRVIEVAFAVAAGQKLESLERALVVEI
jgi:hypothetical protein